MLLALLKLMIYQLLKDCKEMGISMVVIGELNSKPGGWN